MITQHQLPGIEACSTSSGEIMRFDPTRTTNARILPELAQLGIIHPAMVALDTTWGESGLWWRHWRPEDLTSNDINPERPAEYHEDFRDLSFANDTFDLVVFDPPYKYAGTSAHPSDPRYGIGEYLRVQDRDALIRDGISESVRVLRPHGILVVKCQDQQVSGYLRPQSHMVTHHAKSLRCHIVTIIEVAGGVRPQPGVQRTARNNTTQAVVLRNGARTPK